MNKIPVAARAADVPTANPAQVQRASNRERIPMSAPVRKLEVPSMEGWHLYWFREEKIPRALQAGYEFVAANEVSLNQHNPANADDLSGNSDLGTRVRHFAGMGQQGQPEYHYLMKLPIELYNQDQLAIAKRNKSQMESIFINKDPQALSVQATNPHDRGKAYVKSDQTYLAAEDVRAKQH